MAAHIDRRIGIVGAPGTLQALEKGRHRTDIETGLLQGIETDPIGFALEIARISQLRLHLKGLGASQGAGGRLPVGARRQERQRHRDHRDHGGTLPCGYAARNMLLRQMPQFVGHHAGHFGFTLRRQQQAGIDADEASQHRKRVDGRILHHEKLHLEPGFRTRCDQLRTQFLDIGLELGIVKIGKVAPELTVIGFADAALHLRRQRIG